MVISSLKHSKRGKFGNNILTSPHCRYRWQASAHNIAIASRRPMNEPMLHGNVNSRWQNVFGADGWSYADVLPYFMKSESTEDADLLKSGLYSSFPSEGIAQTKETKLPKGIHLFMFSICECELCFLDWHSADLVHSGLTLFEPCTIRKKLQIIFCLQNQLEITRYKLYGDHCIKRMSHVCEGPSANIFKMPWQCEKTSTAVLALHPFPEYHGRNGEWKVSVANRTPELIELYLQTAEELGLKRQIDVNAREQEGMIVKTHHSNCSVSILCCLWRQKTRTGAPKSAWCVLSTQVKTQTNRFLERHLSLPVFIMLTIPSCYTRWRQETWMPLQKLGVMCFEHDRQLIVQVNFFRAT